MEREVTFASAGLTLVGVLHEPDADGPRPAVIDLHGFGGSCSGAGHPELARALATWCCVSIFAAAARARACAAT
jgi:poly(3-hydroxybutyrate) depolymerase